MIFKHCVYTFFIGQYLFKLFVKCIGLINLSNLFDPFDLIRCIRIDTEIEFGVVLVRFDRIITLTQLNT